MTEPKDPQVLEPEIEPGPSARDGGRGAAAANVVEAIALEVERAVPGRAVRVELESVDAARPRSPLSPGPRFRIEVEGKDGSSLLVESGAFGVVYLRFRRATFSWNLLGALGNTGSADDIVAAIGRRAREFANEELVIVEEQVDRLLRLAIFRVEGGRLVELVDSGSEPHVATPSKPRLWSFAGTWNRAPTRQEQARIDRLLGGLMGKLKRKVAEKLFSAAANALEKREVEAQAEPRTPDDVDDGRRLLK